MSERRYIHKAEQAKLLRAALKAEFPAIKFSVVCGRGSSIRIGWQDGPTDAMVKRVTNRFEGGYFDGMTDYRGSYDREVNGERVSFGADFIFTNRAFSMRFYRAVVERVARRFGLGAVEVVESYSGPTLADPYRKIDQYTDLRDHVWREIQKTLSNAAGDMLGVVELKSDPRPSNILATF